MNWYKKAILINKGGQSDIEGISLCCQYCHRWATHPYNDKANPREYVWKVGNQMTPDEKYEADRSLKRLDVSHGICPICMDIIEENSYNLDPKEVRNLSLAQSPLVVASVS